jgi:hypothetical protein
MSRQFSSRCSTGQAEGSSSSTVAALARRLVDAL